MDYCYGMNAINFVVDHTQNGQLAAILDLHYNVMRMKQVIQTWESAAT